ncbi:MAG: TIGR01210 family radical SAM protein, partial [Methanosarcinales archaeon]|nr:TIGR01210 family radical SAM protein [Methanosarcinales archaeon]
GARRGPHNCGQCDSEVAKAIREHALEQDASVFDHIDCNCRSAWRKVIELEDLAFGAPLIDNWARI